MKFGCYINNILRNLFRKRQIESQLDDEFNAYVDMMTDERAVVGVPASEARRTVLAEFGGIEHLKQAVSRIFLFATSATLRRIRLRFPNAGVHRDSLVSELESYPPA